jgi:hypothetical protein
VEPIANGPKLSSKLREITDQFEGAYTDGYSTLLHRYFGVGSVS